MITAVMRDYSRSYSKIECSVLEATLEYGLKAPNVYSHALRRWLEKIPKSFAREKVQKLIADYPKREKKSLQRILQTLLAENLMIDRWDLLAGCHALVHQQDRFCLVFPDPRRTTAYGKIKATS